MQFYAAQDGDSSKFEDRLDIHKSGSLGSVDELGGYVNFDDEVAWLEEANAFFDEKMYIKLAQSETPLPERLSTNPNRPTQHPIPVAIETDIGHDCDDIQALMLAGKDHLYQKIKLVYVSTISGNNGERAKLAKWVFGLMGISDVPIIASDRAVATWKGKTLTDSVPLWQFRRLGNKFHQDTTLEAPASGPPIIDCSGLPSTMYKRLLLQQHQGVRVLVIGPGVEWQTFEGCQVKKAEVLTFTYHSLQHQASYTHLLHHYCRHTAELVSH